MLICYFVPSLHQHKRKSKISLSAMVSVLSVRQEPMFTPNVYKLLYLVGPEKIAWLTKNSIETYSYSISVLTLALETERIVNLLGNDPRAELDSLNLFASVREHLPQGTRFEISRFFLLSFDDPLHLLPRLGNFWILFER